MHPPPPLPGMPAAHTDWSNAPTPTPYDPLDKTNLGRSVEVALMTTPRRPLGAVPAFYGAGIYAIYFVGTGGLYGPLAGTETPIYVGKAIPRGGRKGAGQTPGAVRALWDRIDEHRASVAAAHDLDLGDFEARYLVADELFIPLAERLMIQGYAPVWNVRVDGFGNHDPGSGRRAQARSPWDELHPGRPFAALLRNPSKLTPDEARQAIAEHFAAFPPAATDTAVPVEPLLSAADAEEATQD